MGLPGCRLHPLKGKLTGFWSVSASGNWRAIFGLRIQRCHSLNFDFMSRVPRPSRLNQASAIGAEARMNHAGYRDTRKTSSMVVSPMNAFASPS
jgi:hypothetical protein